ncbi:FIST N-terminal domain-containing protein [Albidovulum sediminicola]|uniref:FIST C-terminal domain-containing protein n=1 Tax=Albidovulum sediminicola TaxID=2984331 RepID=A0ABT2Z315_9RHOB|nr:FIST N-terminal domain-containing protein [Defluviimonas sp. WL0075]MCV2865482.1 FIST C-terminal domain-containing protein [Defluviimonas sp. WL0075]
MTTLKDAIALGHGGLPVVASAHAPSGAPDALERIAAQLGPGPFALILLFAASEAGPLALPARASSVFAGTPVIGCTTAGEISSQGYCEGEIVALALPSQHFAAESILIEDLHRLEAEHLTGLLIRARQRLARAHPDWQGEFAFLMVDGLSIREDELAAAIAPGLGPVPLFGGSAGDGTRFRETFVFHDSRALQNAAVLTFVRTACPVKVFSLDHLQPTRTRMVVTEADPARRIVRQINAEPAALEYARLLGKDPAQLTTFTFAAHPVVVRIGGRHHVRSIQRMLPNGDLVFFSAIDEGLVLTLAEPSDMVDHLAGELRRLAEPGPPAAILACDCILRRIEAQDRQMFGRISDLLRDNRVVGFSTYGEQLGAMHVNQTMTGVAIYPPLGDGP